MGCSEWILYILNFRFDTTGLEEERGLYDLLVELGAFHMISMI